MGKRHFLAGLLLAVAGLTAGAQECPLSMRFYTVAGHSYADNYYLALAAAGEYRAADNLRLSGGLETFRNGGYAVTGAWQANLPWVDRHFFLYNRYLFRLFARWNTEEYSTHIAVGYEDSHWRATLGLANRIMSPWRPYDQTGSTDYVLEPFNLMYEVQLRFALGGSGLWHMCLRAADFDDFVTDRAYQPLFSVGVGRTMMDDLRFYTDLVCYPTGMLSLSANYYQLFMKIGVNKLW